MRTDELRECYLDFFASKGCVRKPSDLLVPSADAKEPKESKETQGSKR